jgi:hypothetical protein
MCEESDMSGEEETCMLFGSQVMRAGFTAHRQQACDLQNSIQEHTTAVPEQAPYMDASRRSMDL